LAGKIDSGRISRKEPWKGPSRDKGTPLVCKDASTWVWSTRQAKGKLVFKLLLNDVTWAQGEDLVVEAGRKIEVLPGF